MSTDRRLERFSVNSGWLGRSGELRFDASFYNPRVAEAVKQLESSGMGLATLGEMSERIFIPPRFKRVYVDSDHGTPFLQGSHVVHFQPADLKYLSNSAHKNMEKWIIHEGWILVTCSGTIGRTAITPKQWDGWAASQHILRIVPKADGYCPPGYLYAYLTSPAGQAQLTARIYGAVVDELTEDQARSILIPVPETPEQREEVEKINDLAMQSVKKRMEAVALAEQAVMGLDSLVPPLEKSEADDGLSAFERFQSLTQNLLAVPKGELVEPHKTKGEKAATN